MGRLEEIWKCNCYIAFIGAMISLAFVILLFSPLLGFSKNVIKANVDHSDLKMEPESYSNDICGDPECNLVCTEGQECQPTGNECVMPPCCVAWQCVDTDPGPSSKEDADAGPSPRLRSTPEDEECPTEWPEMGESCSPPGLSCEYGWEICCGERVPDVVFVCEGGSWQMIWIDSRCDLGMPCESTTTERSSALPDKIGFE